MKQAVLYICYYNITEPLVQSQVVSYLRDLAKRGFPLHLLTFERENLSQDQRRHIEDELDRDGIRWHSLRYHQHPSLLATLYDIVAGTLASFFICRKHRINLIHARSYVPGVMALVLKRVTGCKMLLDVRGLLADEYADAGHWTRSSLKFRLTKRMERTLFRSADALVVLTNTIRKDLTERDEALRHRDDDIEVIPCCANIEKFSISASERQAFRRARGWDNRRVLTYVGKFGTWYLAREMANFFAAAQMIMPNLFFQILTQADSEPIREALEAAGVGRDDYDIRFAPPNEVPLVLASSDAGISFIRQCYSKRSSSPTKVGEYLASGLPVVANAGIGDCDRMLLDNHIGVIVDSFHGHEFQQAAQELLSLMQEVGIAGRCRKVAERELSMADVGGPRYAAIYKRLLTDGELVLACHDAVSVDPASSLESNVQD